MRHHVVALAALLLTVPLSAQSLRVTTPPGSAGSADVVVTNPDGQSDTVFAGFEYVAPPLITSVSPDAGPMDGGTEIVIEGESFEAGAVVTIGGVVAPLIDAPFPDPLEVTTSTLPDGVVGVYYEFQLTATGAGGEGTYLWSLESGSLPDGLTLSGTGLISGVPTTATIPQDGPQQGIQINNVKP